MSDTWMEQMTNLEFVENARGDVLIGGLGIGMVLLAVQDKPEVTSVTVVEKEREVIDLVARHLPLNGKVRIVNENIHAFEPEQDYDTIYLDIWDTISADNFAEMAVLHANFSRRLRGGGWIDSWRRDDCWRMAGDELDGC